LANWFGLNRAGLVLVRALKVMQVTDSSRSAGVHGHRMHGVVGDELERGWVVAAQSARARSMSRGIPGYAWPFSAGRGLAPAVARGLTDLGWSGIMPSTSLGQGCGYRGLADVAAAPPLILSTATMTRSPGS